MAAPVSSSNPAKSSQSLPLAATNSPDVKVTMATIGAFEATTQNSTSLNERVTTAFDDQSSLHVDLPVYLSTIRMSQKKSLKAPDNSPDLSVAQGTALPPIDLPPPAKPQ